MGRITEYSAQNLLPELNLDPGRWPRKPTSDEVEIAAGAVQEKAGVRVVMAKDGEEALKHIMQIIPLGSEVMNGSSTTLNEIGFIALLTGEKSPWRDLHSVITSENDKEKRDDLRRKAVTANYFISGVNAIALSGELIACDATGSRVGAWPFAAKNLVLVSGVNKIVRTVEEGLRRISEYAYSLEDARIRKASGARSHMGKFVILANERISGRTTLVLIDDILGY